jgi:hypothetical protein
MLKNKDMDCTQYKDFTGVITAERKGVADSSALVYLKRLKKRKDWAIPASLEAEIGGITVPGQPRQKVSKTLSQPTNLC